MKLKLFISQLDDANMNPFPHLKEQIEGAVHNGNLRKCTTKIKSLPDSIESRFCNFAEGEDCTFAFINLFHLEDKR